MSRAAYTKKVNISIDEATWKELPVENVTLNKVTALQDNTDLSNNDSRRSRIYGIRDWSVVMDGNFRPDVTYQWTLKRSGTPVSFTDEAMTNTTGNTWKIDDSVKEIWDRTASFTFEDNAVAIPAGDIESIDYLNGTVTFTGSKSGPITVSGDYIPVTASICANTASMDMAIDVEEDTNIKDVAANDGYKTRNIKLRDVSVSLTAFNDLSKAFITSLKANEVVLLEITLANTDTQVIRGWFLIESANDAGAVGDLETQDVTLQLDGDILSSFSWAYPVSGFNEALRILTDFFFSGGDLFVQHLPDNVIANGFQGKVVMESFGLSLDLNAKTTFSSTLQGNGELKDAV